MIFVILNKSYSCFYRESCKYYSYGVQLSCLVYRPICISACLTLLPLSEPSEELWHNIEKLFQT